MVHATRTSLAEMGDKLGEEDRKNVEAAIEAVEEAMKSDDKDAIDAATNRLTEAAQVVYQQAAAEQQPGGDQPESSAEAAADDVVDAEFEEVDDDKDK
jgi:molecular chaperone DnaK